MQDTILDFIRHGEPVGGRRYRGNAVDDPLSEKGWQQMWNAVGEDSPWQHVVSSPLQRCRAFAERLAERDGLALSVEMDLREVGFGSWEGSTHAELRTRRAEEYAAFYQDPVLNRPAGAEPLDEFSRRISGVFDRLAERFDGRHLLVVAHAGVVRAALGHVLGIQPQAWYRTRVANAGLTRFRIEAHGRVLDFHNRPGLD